MVVVTVRGQHYHMDDKLVAKWDKTKDGRLAKYDEDRFYIVDGAEGSGKSLFTLQQAAYIDETILDDVGEDKLPRICFSVQEFLDAIRTTKSTIGHTKVIVFDEAFRGLSSKSSLSKNNKLLVTALMEARQNNLIVFLVTPSFYLLEFYGAVLRSQALFHVIKEKKTRLRYVRVFNKKDKAILYQIGVRKGWGYPRRTKFRVRFFNLYPGGADFEKRYRKKKSDNFGQDSAKSKAEIAYFAKAENYKEQRDKLLYILKQHTKLTYSTMSKELKKYDIILAQQNIGEICRDEAYRVNKGIPLVPTKDKAEQKVDEVDEFEEEEEESQLNENGDEGFNL
jgi:predicted ABC-type ATPase